MTYITINDQTFATDTETDITEAKAAMVANEITSAKVYTAPYDTVEAAEAAGFDGAYANGQVLTVEV